MLIEITEKVITNPSDEDISKIRKNLQGYNLQHLEIQSKDSYAINLYEQDSFIGGLVCTHVGNWLELDFLWIDKSYRKSGLGDRLMKKLEGLAKDLKCTSLSTNTFSFQAKPFYEKNGFHVVYTQKNYPVTSTKYFMEKHLK